MPSEKFYHESDENRGPGGMFEIVWGDGDDGVEIYLYAYKLREDGRPKDVHSIAPDRETLNRLIRSLRRARNAKYGTDE